jgi:DNA-binding NarL/FixJ family response regulator
MQRIRVLLAGMPRMLMSIVKNIVVSQDDFELAGEIMGENGLQQAATEVQADVIILGALAETKDYHDLLWSNPRTKIIAIAADGRDAVLHELQPRMIPLDEVSPVKLVAAIRNAVHSEGGPSVANNE